MCSKPAFRHATLADVDALCPLINAAFVAEAPFFEGERTHADGVRGYLSIGTFIMAEQAGGLAGCVYVELRDHSTYVGLLSVHPRCQRSGLGTLLMSAAEEFSLQHQRAKVDLRIVSPRPELLQFYERLGYRQQDTSPYPIEARAKVPGHFINMSKLLDARLG